MGIDNKNIDISNIAGLEPAEPFEYTRDDIQELFDKMRDAHVLTVEEYNKLMSIDFDNLSTFSGDYNEKQ